ncbi:hypothetical protein ES702_02440 [subsurface metagenome]
MPYKTIPVSEDLFKELQRIKKKTEKRLGVGISWDVFIQNLLGNDSAVADAIAKILKGR